MKKIWQSLKGKILITIFAAIVLMTMGSMCINYYSTQVIQERIYENDKILLQGELKQLDQALTDTFSWIASEATNYTGGTDYLSEDPIVSERAKAKLFQVFYDNLAAQDCVEGFIAYAPSNGNLVCVNNTKYSSYKVRDEVRQYVTADPSSLLDNGRWVCCEVGEGDEVLITGAYWGGIYYFAWTPFNRLMKKLEISSESASVFLFVDPNDQILYMSDSVEGLSEDHDLLNDGETGTTGSYYYVGENKEYLAVETNSSQADFSLVKIDNRKELLGSFGKIYQTLTGIIVVLLLIDTMVILKSLNHSIFHPVARLEKGIQEIQAGNLEVQIENRRSTPEMSHLVDSFNDMTGQIRDLKIQVYEDQLEHQRQEMDYLQLQLEPHFYLNALNLINMMAQVGDTELIQQLTENLAEYLRYVVSARRETVTVQQELDHVSHYLKIMEIRLGEDSFTFESQTDPEALHVQILPLTLQTIVENSLKYAFSLERQTKISMTVAREEGQLKILVTDNGPGYPEEILKSFQENQQPEGKHIGLWNLKLRQEYLYKGEGSFRICNGNPETDLQGACTELILPVSEATEQKE